jgi:lipopolysaccharide/colanic/teichoic acid biosynthesis glycosyltransferase
MIRVFRIHVPVGALALLFSEVLLIFSCFVALTFLILNVDPAVFLFTDRGLARIGLAVASLLFGLFFEDLYTQIYIKSRVLLAQQLSLVAGMALLFQGLISYINDELRVPLRVMLPACALTIVILFGWRIAYSALVLQVVGPQRILFVGMSPLVEALSRHIETHPELGLDVLGYVGNGAEPGARFGTGKVLGPIGELPEIAAMAKPDRILVGLAERRQQMPIASLLKLRYGGMAIEEAASAYEELCGRTLLSELHPAELVLSGGFRMRQERLVYQTLGNWVLAAFLTAVSAPFLVLATILLKFSSRGSLLSFAPRVGLGGRPFRLYGFRLDGNNPAQRFVRRWRLDALPHLWNVLRGDMCFVGPRADRPEFAQAMEELIPFYRQLQRVKPGLTGWAQINLPQGEPEDTLRRLEYDFYYLKNSSQGLDSYILLHAFKELLISPAA